MAKQAKKLDFSEDSCGIGNMLKYVIDLFNCNSFPCMSISSRAYNAITTFPYNFLDLIPTCLPIFCEELGFEIILPKQILDQSFGASAFLKQLHELVNR